MDDAAFIPGLKDQIKWLKSNSPLEVENQIRSLLRLAEGLEAGQDTDSRFITAAGVGGSASLIVGGTLLVATPPLAVTLALAGMVVAGISYFGVRKIDGDKLLCSQIVSTLRKIDEALG
jgi:hypothetical protein